MPSAPGPELDAAPAPAAPPRASAGQRRFWPRFRARTRTIWRRLATLLGPLVATGLLIWGVALAYGQRIGYELLVVSVASWLWMGTTVILAPAVLDTQISLGTWEIAVWMIWLNTAAAFFYAYNLDLLEKLPVIGPYLRRARRNAAIALEDHPWIRRMAAFGVGLFVITPLPGSGQLGGCFIGRIVGLPRRVVFLSVTLAGTLVSVLYAMGGSWVKRVLDEGEIGLWIRVGGAVLLLVCAWLVFKMLRYLGREEAPARPPPAGSDA